MASPYEYEAKVRVTEPATTLFLKASYHPDWRAYVDGEEVTPFMVAPSYPAIALEPGEHTVRFEYRATHCARRCSCIRDCDARRGGLIEVRRRPRVDVDS